MPRRSRTAAQPYRGARAGRSARRAGGGARWHAGAAHGGGARRHGGAAHAGTGGRRTVARGATPAGTALRVAHRLTHGRAAPVAARRSRVHGAQIVHASPGLGARPRSVVRSAPGRAGFGPAFAGSPAGATKRGRKLHRQRRQTAGTGFGGTRLRREGGSPAEGGSAGTLVKAAPWSGGPRPWVGDGIGPDVDPTGPILVHASRGLGAGPRSVVRSAPGRAGFGPAFAGSPAGGREGWTESAPPASPAGGTAGPPGRASAGTCVRRDASAAAQHRPGPVSPRRVAATAPAPTPTVPPGQNHTVDRATAEELDRQDPVATFRDRFRIPADGPIYLDGNSLGRPSHTVVDAIAAGVESWERQLVGGWSRWINLPVEVGDRLGVLLGAGPGQVLVCDSTTVNLFKLADAALTLQGAGPVAPSSSVMPTIFLRTGTCWLVWPRPGGASYASWRRTRSNGADLDDLRATLDERTALVCLSHVNYRSAARLDLAAVTSLAHDCGALVLWDLSHSAGAVPVGLDEAGVDLAVGCTYKYLNAGPGAPGYLYVRRELAGRLRQPIQGWFGQHDQFEMGRVYQPASGVGRFLTGTPGVLGLLAVQAGVDLLLEAGLDRLWTKSRALTELLVELVGQRLQTAGAMLASPRDADRRGAHVSIAHPRAWPWCTALIEKGLVVPDFRTPDVMRLGPAPLYTRFVDVYDAVERIRDIAAADRAEGPAWEVRPRVT